MAGKNGNDVQASYLAHLKSKSQLVSLLSSSSQVKESQWQGTTFVYPAVRISVDFYPAINGCQDRADVFIDVFSEKKSSDEASTIAGVIQSILHRHPFSSVGVQFFSVIVSQVQQPERDIYAWKSQVQITSLLA